MIDHDPLDWFCWMLISGRNNWWYPDETGEDCASAGKEEPTEVEIVREQGQHWGKFLAYDELIHDFGKALLLHDGEDPEGGFSREEMRKRVQEGCQRELERSREHGLDLPDEKFRAELEEEWQEFE